MLKRLTSLLAVLALFASLTGMPTFAQDKGKDKAPAKMESKDKKMEGKDKKAKAKKAKAKKGEAKEKKDKM
jgi:hypothetical protein